ncbi:MAG: 23S rRNA (adenine(2503)-C(2))-methyltransferase RlmN [Planctomycetota bacterium]|nr:MAG: 23S rRNA (adenine(2503)-C(2))-methyltransferase RlmN [Planctomycetota bacterium]
MSDAPRLPALTDLGTADYGRLAELPGARSFTPGQVRRWVLGRGARSWQDMTDLGKTLRAAGQQSWRVRRGRLDATHTSRDGTLGLLTRLDDGNVIESVSIPEGDRRTLCISSQVGCAVGCQFCASGIGGAERNLSVGEIIEQVLVGREASPEAPLTNYVFMGSGEPTHNLSAVLGAIRIMNHPDGLGIGARRITVSTTGQPTALRKLAEEPIPFHLALSLHLPGDREREALMPGIGASDLAATLDAAGERFARTGRRVTAEVVLLAGVNDDRATARRLALLLAGRPVAVNLIPWNPVDGVDHAPPRPGDVETVAGELRRAGITTTIRRPRGQDVGVACGQLRRRAGAERRAPRGR